MPLTDTIALAPIAEELTLAAPEITGPLVDVGVEPDALRYALTVAIAGGPSLGAADFNLVASFRGVDFGGQNPFTVPLDVDGNGSATYDFPETVVYDPAPLLPNDFQHGLSLVALRDDTEAPIEDPDYPVPTTLSGTVYVYSYLDAVELNEPPVLDFFNLSVSNQEYEVVDGIIDRIPTSARHAVQAADYAQVGYTLNISNGPAFARVAGVGLPYVWRDGSWLQLMGAESIGLDPFNVDVQLDGDGNATIVRSGIHDVLRSGLGVQPNELVSVRFNGQLTLNNVPVGFWTLEYDFSAQVRTRSIGYVDTSVPAVSQALLNDLSDLFTELVTEFNGAEYNDRAVAMHTLETTIGENGERRSVLSPNPTIVYGFTTPMSQSAASRALGRPTAERIFEFSLPKNIDGSGDLNDLVFVTNIGVYGQGQQEWVAIPGENNLGQAFRAYTKFLAKRRS